MANPIEIIDPALEAPLLRQEVRTLFAPVKETLHQVTQDDHTVQLAVLCLRIDFISLKKLSKTHVNVTIADKRDTMRQNVKKHV